MHYLVLQKPAGHRLVGFSDAVLELRRDMLELKREDQQSVPAIYSDDTIKKLYLCDDYGLPIEEDGWLIRLDDL